MKRASEWPWGPIVAWAISIAGASWMWSLVAADQIEEEERKINAIGRYELIDRFPFKDGDYSTARIYKNRITGDCILYLGARRGRTITSISCPEANQ